MAAKLNPHIVNWKTMALLLPFYFLPGRIEALHIYWALSLFLDDIDCTLSHTIDSHASLIYLAKCDFDLASILKQYTDFSTNEN